MEDEVEDGGLFRWRKWVTVLMEKGGTVAGERVAAKVVRRRKLSFHFYSLFLSLCNDSDFRGH